MYKNQQDNVHTHCPLAPNLSEGAISSNITNTREHQASSSIGDMQIKYDSVNDTTHIFRECYAPLAIEAYIMHRTSTNNGTFGGLVDELQEKYQNLFIMRLDDKILSQLTSAQESCLRKLLGPHSAGLSFEEVEINLSREYANMQKESIHLPPLTSLVNNSEYSVAYCETTEEFIRLMRMEIEIIFELRGNILLDTFESSRCFMEYHLLDSHFVENNITAPTAMTYELFLGIFRDSGIDGLANMLRIDKSGSILSAQQMEDRFRRANSSSETLQTIAFECIKLDHDIQCGNMFEDIINHLWCFELRNLLAPNGYMLKNRLHEIMSNLICCALGKDANGQMRLYAAVNTSEFNNNAIKLIGFSEAMMKILASMSIFYQDKPTSFHNTIESINGSRITIPLCRIYSFDDIDPAFPLSYHGMCPHFSFIKAQMLLVDEQFSHLMLGKHITTRRARYSNKKLYKKGRAVLAKEMEEIIYTARKIKAIMNTQLTAQEKLSN